MNLGELAIREIAHAIRKARSLVAIHLSGNPGLTESTRSFLIERIRCKPNEDI